MLKISKNRILFGAYIIIITVFFLYYLFPSESLKDYCAYRLSQINPEIRVNIKSIKLAFPPGYRLSDVDLYYLEQAVGSIDHIKIKPNLLSFIGQDTRWSYSGKAYTGKFSGTAEIASNSPTHQVLIDTAFSGIQIKDIDAIRRVTDYQISGMLDGKLVYKADSRNQTLRGNIRLSNCKVGLSIPLLNQGSLMFKDVTADLLMNNQTLTIQRCRAQGNQMDASISGTIAYNLSTGQRALDLSGTLNPHNVLLAKLKNSFPVNLFKGDKSDDQGFPFKIRGSLDAPEFSFN
jgi:type II secretion system protein N